MISGGNYKSVEIDIKIYKYRYNTKTMNRDKSIDKRCCKNNPNRFICSICLNKNSIKDENRNIECCKRKSKSCPICDKTFDVESNNNDSVTNFCQNKDNYRDKSLHNKKDLNGKNIQTSQPDVTQGLSLLNEVLTVFQSKKQCETKNSISNKTIILKDASVGTDEVKRKSNLNMSKVFYFSIQDNNQIQENQFIILNQQPESKRVSQLSMDLVKHKSSSIPQMKLEELKNSFKEKTKSKDAIEEVNRMFATVRKCEINEPSEASNRPITRNGPRVLPVVKTTNKAEESNIKPIQNCRFCQTNYRLSSGDSTDCCHKPNDRCDECFYMMCCHYQHRLNCGTACPNCRTERDHSKNGNDDVPS